MNLKSIYSKNLLISTICVLALCIIFRQKLQLFTETIVDILNEKFTDKILVTIKSPIRVLSEKQLEKFDGIAKKELFLAFLGSVFDVSAGRKHYQKGSDYNYFIGKDGSRAFLTGNFKDESTEKDHILDLPCDNIMALLQWNHTYTTKYKYIGVLNGRYYNRYGEETPYMRQVHVKIQACKREKKVQSQFDKKFPHCNVAWQADEGYKVWCTKSSGGVSRNWVGVPRLLFKPGDSEGQCVCMNPGVQYELNVMFKQYENCHPQEETCYLGQTNPNSLSNSR